MTVTVRRLIHTKKLIKSFVSSVNTLKAYFSTFLLLPPFLSGKIKPNYSGQEKTNVKKFKFQKKALQSSPSFFSFF